ncbi:MAG: type II toxin-antitoxin system PemK/MazF family toxin [Bacilli bacterium]|nr:type II toxin-antitoxin system PemK/MazF family toxin [Clostridia bacterium]MBQ9854061.1 type II toxin-antitoxin system PemK/MazF family toxin [Bacilli bacterium]
MENYEIKKGDVYFASLNPIVGSEQDGERPVVVVQNNLANKHSPTIIVVPITTVLKRMELPTHIPISKNRFLKKDSMILVEQIRAIDKKRLKAYLGHLKPEQMKLVDNAIVNVFELKVKLEEKL